MADIRSDGFNLSHYARNQTFEDVSDARKAEQH